MPDYNRSRFLQLLLRKKVSLTESHCQLNAWESRAMANTAKPHVHVSSIASSQHPHCNPSVANWSSKCLKCPTRASVLQNSARWGIQSLMPEIRIIGLRSLLSWATSGAGPGRTFRSSSSGTSGSSIRSSHRSRWKSEMHQKNG